MHNSVQQIHVVRYLILINFGSRTEFSYRIFSATEFSVLLRDISHVAYVKMFLAVSDRN